MSYILGLDLSLTATGVVVVDASELANNPRKSLVASAVLHCPGDAPSTDIDRALRLIELRRQLDSFINSFAPGGCFIPVFAEGYAFGRGEQSHYLGELGGVMSVLFADKYKVAMTRVAAATWRSLLLTPRPKGTGRRPKGIAKKECIAAIRSLLGQPKLKGDVCDAWGIANYGASTLGYKCVILREQQ